MPRRRGRAEAGMHPTLTHRAATAAGPRPAGSDTLAGLLARRLDESPHAAAIAVEASPAAGTRHWTWADLAAAAAAVADAFVAAGLRRGDRVAHVGPHAPDWIVVDLACLLAGLEHAAVHHGGDVADEARSLAWLAPRAVIRSGVPGRPGDPPQIVVEPAGGGDVDGARCAGIEAAAPSRVEADLADLRATIARHAAACDPEAGCAVLLSSGTTGAPLGYVHSQRALAANAVAASDVFLAEPRDVRLSWLPLSHGMARVGDLYTTLVRGGCLHVVRDRRRCLDACRALPPTVVLGVPAFFERIERGVRAGRIADLAAALGGRVRVCVSGGAALRARTAACFAARGVPLVEGYGLAEAGPVVAVSNPRIARPGTVGPPLAGVEVRIDDRPASRGQVLVRTPSRAVAVLAPAETGEVRMDRGAVDGWIETGDVGELDAAGHLRITGRLRDTLVLSNGTKLPPAAVERALAEDEAVAQVCVVGDGLPWPVAVIVPDPDEVRAALRRLGIRVFSRRAALEHPRLLAWFGRRLVRRQERLPRGWRVRRAFLVGRPFDAAHGEATESLKIRRDRVAEHFAARIAAAAEAAPPRWACAVPTGESADERGPAAPWLTTALWRGADGGFAAAAERAAVPSRESVNAVVDRAVAELARLRAEGTLYDPPPTPPAPAAPLADAPAPPAGRFSAAAEAALGRTGLWGLAVPEPFGGTGAGMPELARAITRLAADCPTAAGMLAVHSTIGAVTALSAFGTDEQRTRLLPGLAAGSPLSIFGATEPDVGCDLGAVRATLERREGRLLLTGTKMFITNATHGRLMKVLALLDGRPAVALVRLPAADGPTFRLRHYAIHPLRHAHNAATEFTGFAVDEADLLAAPGGDGMRIVWHGLNRGRTTLAAQAAGTLRILLAQARAHALARSTWGRPIADRELVRGRLARIAAAIAACDAVSAWAAAAIESGGTGELEAIVAKTTASECVRAAAVDALGVHGGRAFLVGHPLGDSFHDHLAVGVYEGESDLLGLALLKGLAKGWPAAAAGHDAAALRRAAAWLAWRAASLARGAGRDAAILDRRLRDHARAARRLLARAAGRIDRAIRRHGRSLAERQLVAGALAADVRDLAAVLATCHHADATARDAAAADCFCRLARARVRGARPSAADHAALAALGASMVSGPS